MHHFLKLAWNVLAMIVLLGFGAWWIYTGYGPWTWDLSSDEAIPWLMINIGPVNTDFLFLWGQDRIGGWPFFMQRILKTLLHMQTWTLENIQVTMALGILVGGWAFSNLLARPRSSAWCSLGALSLYLLVLFHPHLGWALVQSSAYVWQIPVVLLALWQLQRWSAQPTSIPALATLLVFFAVWSSPLSIVIVASALMAFAWEQRRFPRTAVPGFSRWSAVILLLPMAGAWLIKKTHAVFATYPFGETDFRMGPLEIKTNFIPFFRYLLERPFYPVPDSLLPLQYLYFVNIVILLGLICSKSLRSRTFGVLAHDPYLRRCFVLFVAFVGAALVESLVLAGSFHFRANDYHPRYYTMVHLYSLLGTATLAVGFVPQFLRAPVCTLMLGTLLAWRVWEIAQPFPNDNPAKFLKTQATAKTLEEVVGGEILLGRYWEVYKLIPLQTRSPMLPLVSEGDGQRTGWVVPLLANASRVVVHFPQEAPAEVVLHGTHLRRGQVVIPQFSIYTR